MSSPLAIHGGTPVISRTTPHIPWPPIDDTTMQSIIAQLQQSVSIPDRSGIIAMLEDRLADYFGMRHTVLTSSGTAALHAEGCLAIDTPGSTCPLNQLPLFTDPHELLPDLSEDWPRYGAGQFPRAEELHRSTMKITVPHDDNALADGYVQAIQKVFNNLHHFRRR